MAPTRRTTGPTYRQTVTPQVVGYAATADSRLLAAVYPAPDGWVGLVLGDRPVVVRDRDRAAVTRRVAAALRRRGWRAAPAA